MSDRHYNQKALSTLRFLRVDWGDHPSLVFEDSEGGSVLIPLTPETASKIVRSVIPILLPGDGTGFETTTESAAPGQPVRTQGYFPIGHCDGALYTATTSPDGPTIFFRDGRKVPTEDLPESMRVAALKKIP